MFSRFSAFPLPNLILSNNSPPWNTRLLDLLSFNVLFVGAGLWTPTIWLAPLPSVVVMVFGFFLKGGTDPPTITLRLLLKGTNINYNKCTEINTGPLIREKFYKFDKVAPISESTQYFHQNLVILNIHVIHLDLIYMGIDFANLTKLPRFWKPPIDSSTFPLIFWIYFMKIGQLCQIVKSHLTISILKQDSYILYLHIWQTCPILIKYMQKNINKTRKSIGTFSNRGNFVKL